MSKTCYTCNRGTKAGMSRSHSNIGTKRKLHVNLQSVKKDGKKVRICTNCIKTENKTGKILS